VKNAVGGRAEICTAFLVTTNLDDALALKLASPLYLRVNDWFNA